MSDNQDWTTVVLNKKRSVLQNTKPPIKKVNFTSNTVKNINCDDGKDMDIMPVYVDKVFGIKIQKARNLRKITQSQLAKEISIPVSVIIDYEQGKGVRNGHYISLIKKHLNIDKNTL